LILKYENCLAYCIGIEVSRHKACRLSIVHRNCSLDGATDRGNRNPQARKTHNIAVDEVGSALRVRPLRKQEQYPPKVLRKNIQHALRQAADWGRFNRRARKRREERLLTELSALKRRIAAVESERDTARHRLEALESSLAQSAASRLPVPHHANARHPVLKVASAAGFVLLLGALAGPAAFQDAQGLARELQQTVMLATVETRPEARTPGSIATNARSGEAEPLSRQSLQERIRRLGHTRPATHRQWGPPLFARDTQPVKRAGTRVPDPLVARQQQSLLDLGFDLGQASADGLKGARTEQALREFQSLYLSGADEQNALGPAELDFVLGVYADLAREDAKKFNIDRGVLAAIRFSSVRTGVEFSYLMELAAAESNFDPVARASGSSAVGLYQFTHDTWLNTVKTHGETYGLEDYASHIEFVVDRRGNKRPRVADTAVYEHILDLRKNPRVSALMAAEAAKDHRQELAFLLNGEPGPTELYLTHFFGKGDAISFLKVLDENPDTFAVDVFPEAAQSNHSIFHPKTCEPRTVNEIYEVFSEKFHASRYEAWKPN
jgi:hypothetical protein